MSKCWMSGLSVLLGKPAVSKSAFGDFGKHNIICFTTAFFLCFPRYNSIQNTSTQCEHPSHPSLTGRNEQPWPFVPWSPANCSIHSKKNCPQTQRATASGSNSFSLPALSAKKILSRRGYKTVSNTPPLRDCSYL